MTATDIFADIKKSATLAMDGALQDTATELTKKFRKHLTTAGIPDADIAKSKMVYNRETDTFDPDVPKAVNDRSYGSEDETPTGVVVQFTNSVTALSIKKMHDKYLYDRSRDEGLA